MTMKQWYVRVMRRGQSVHIGRVAESTETLARCAALSRYGVSEDKAEEIERNRIAPRSAVIYPNEEFDVSPAT